MAPTIYFLTRDGQFYMWSDDREQLTGVVASNPDFTARNPDGSEPIAVIMEYSLKNVISI